MMNRPNSDIDLCEAARASPILQDVEEEALSQLVERALCHEYPKNNILFYQGDPPGAVFLVLSGRVKVTLLNEEGREVIATIARPGDFFGLVAALDERPQPANAITSERSLLAKFDAEVLLNWLKGQRAAQQALLARLGGQLREAYGKIGEHALMNVKERLLYALLDIAELEGQPDPDGQMVAFTRPTHQELAHRVGSSREVVSRMLKELLDSELLQAEGRVIRVPESALVLRED